MDICPCGSGKSYSHCCQIFISGTTTAPTAEALMRSRFSAYAKGDLDYIERTMQGPALRRFDKNKSQARANEVKWTRLEILKTFQDNNRHFVEFIAHFSIQDQSKILHECSEFLFENNQWYYIHGKIFPEKVLANPKKTGRNDICTCGSQKKFKHCCGSKR